VTKLNYQGIPTQIKSAIFDFEETFQQGTNVNIINVIFTCLPFLAYKDFFQDLHMLPNYPTNHPTIYLHGAESFLRS